MRLAIVATALLLAGCAAPSAPVPFDVGRPFDEEKARVALLPGTNLIQGSAFMRQQGGGVVTCAGAEVSLLPSTLYTEVRLSALYPGTDQTRMRRATNFVFNPDPPAYQILKKTTRCDAQGSFEFDRVSDGAFFLITLVTWQAGNVPQGGFMMQRITVQGGEIKKVVVSN